MLSIKYFFFHLHIFLHKHLLRNYWIQNCIPLGWAECYFFFVHTKDCTTVRQKAILSLRVQDFSFCDFEHLWHPFVILCPWVCKVFRNIYIMEPNIYRVVFFKLHHNLECNCLEPLPKSNRQRNFFGSTVFFSSSNLFTYLFELIHNYFCPIVKNNLFAIMFLKTIMTQNCK